MVSKHQKRISGPVLDRIDLDVPRVMVNVDMGAERSAENLPDRQAETLLMPIMAVERMGLSARADHFEATPHHYQFGRE